MDSHYNIFNDEYFRGYINSNRVIDVSEKKYAKDLIKLSKAMDMEFGEIVIKCKEQQKTTGEIHNVDGKQLLTIDEFDAESPNSFVKKIHDEYVAFCQNNGNSNVTINNGIMVLRTFLKHYNVKLSKWTPLEDDKADWNCLTKEDFIFVMKDSSLPHQALITFMLSTGIRIGDCLTFTIKDFMKATSDYHEFTDVNEFIDNAPDDMVGFWDFLPKKTKKHNIRCTTLNSAESSNYILQNLRRIKNQYLPRKSKRIKQELKISKDDALFGSHHKMYKKPMTVKGITDQFTLKSHKLHAWRVSQIKNSIAKGDESEEDFEDLEEQIPRFHAHGCRKYFQTIVGNNCGNLRLCALMEGHKMPLKNDPSYFNVEITKDYIKDVYMDKLHDLLVLENVETRVITTEEGEELRKKLDRVTAELEEYKNKSNNVNIQYEDKIWLTITDYYRKKYDESIHSKKSKVLCQYALELAIKNIINFNADDKDYLDTLFIQAEGANDLYPENFEEMLEKASKHYSNKTIENMELKQKVNKILIQSAKYGYVETIIKSNYKLAEKCVVRYLEENTLSDEDLNNDEVVKNILLEIITSI